MLNQTGFIEQEADGTRYVVYVPHGAAKPMPAILFLHGAGESGDDNLRQVIQGVGSAVMWDRSRWPFVILFAQKPVLRELWPTRVENLNAILRHAEQHLQLDPHRRYITGLSQGGNGTFVLAKRLAWQFAAAAPICGWCDPEQAAKDFRDIPLWAFHGLDDDVVKPEGSTKAVDAIKAAGGTAQVTLYEGVGHNSWDKAYRESELPTWLLAQSLR